MVTGAFVFEYYFFEFLIEFLILNLADSMDNGKNIKYCIKNWMAKLLK